MDTINNLSLTAQSSGLALSLKLKLI